MNNILNKFSKGEFFSVLPPGFYIFIVVYSCAYIDFTTSTKNSTLWDNLVLLARQLKDQPVFLIFVLFASYMLGSIFRALPVSWAERTIPPYTSRFPYPEILKDVIDTLNKYQYSTMHDQAKMISYGKEIPMHVFNYWKDVLCVNSIEGFSFYQTFETRVRLFSGIIWSSWAGIVGSVYIFARAKDLNSIGISLFIISLVLIVTFGSNFRRVRRQEARALLLIYTAYIQSKDNAPNT